MATEEEVRQALQAAVIARAAAIGLDVPNTEVERTYHQYALLAGIDLATATQYVDNELFGRKNEHVTFLLEAFAGHIARRVQQGEKLYSRPVVELAQQLATAYAELYGLNALEVSNALFNRAVDLLNNSGS